MLWWVTFILCQCHQSIDGTSINIPVSLDNTLHHFNFDYCALQNDSNNNRLFEVIREFCIVHRIVSNDCRTLMKEGEKKVKGIECNVSKDSNQQQRSSPPIENIKMLLYASTSRNRKEHLYTYYKDDDIYIQLTSSAVLQHLSPHASKRLAMKFNNKNVSPNRFGRQSDTWSFVAPDATSMGQDFLLDDVLGSFENTNLYVVVPNDPGSIPWSPSNPMNSTLVLVFDGSNSRSESVQDYLARVQDLLHLINNHKENEQLEIGLVVLGDRQGLFPTSMYNQVSWSMRQYYFSDHVSSTGQASPMWLPLGPMFVQEESGTGGASGASGASGPSGSGSGGNDGPPFEKEKDTLLLAIVPDSDDKSTESMICERGTAEQSTAHAAGPRCYGTWQRKEIVKAVKSLQQWSTEEAEQEKQNTNRDESNFPSSFPRRIKTVSKNDPNLLDWMRRSIFVISSSEHLSTGSESRVMWTALENDAIPIIAGPAHQLGLKEFGTDHPLPELNPSMFSKELIKLMKPFLFSSVVRTTAFTVQDSQEPQDQLEQHDLEIQNASRNRQLMHLRRRVALWYKNFYKNIQCRHIFDQDHHHHHHQQQQQQRQPQKLPFEYLLESYIHWNKYHQSKRTGRSGSHLEHSYRSAFIAVKQQVSPSPLRIFALENLAAVEQTEAMNKQNNHIMGWQQHNRRSIVTISEALRIVLGEFPSERILYPWLPKLLHGASALAWNLGALRSAEQLTHEALRYNPLSVEYLKQLVEIWKQLSNRAGDGGGGSGGSGGSGSGGSGQVALMNANDNENRTRVEEDNNNDPIYQMSKYANLLQNISGYKDSHWSVAPLGVVKKWWRCDELENQNNVLGVHTFDVESTELSTSSMWTQSSDGKSGGYVFEDIVSLLSTTSGKKIIPMEQGDKDAVDELLWLLDREDTSPLLVLLEMGEEGS
jgi:uncharacterized membrane protein YgcG